MFTSIARKQQHTTHAVYTISIHHLSTFTANDIPSKLGAGRELRVNGHTVDFHTDVWVRQLVHGNYGKTRTRGIQNMKRWD